jgi:hypothetical protein
MSCTSSPFCAVGECVDICEEPLKLCRNKCLDYQTDPFNCGSCRNLCESGICEEGVCGDVIAGDVVVIGHDYRRAVVAMQRFAYNAVDRARGRPVRALMFEGDASQASIVGVRNAINRIASRDGREWVEIPVSAANMTRELLQSDVVLIPAQNEATDERLRQLGQRWATAFLQFVARGGVIVLFETTSPSNAGTFQLLEPSGLFEAESRSVVPNGTRLRVDVATAIGTRVSSVYEAVQASLAFEGVTTPGAIVASTPDGRPVVIHRVIER